MVPVCPIAAGGETSTSLEPSIPPLLSFLGEDFLACQPGQPGRSPLDPF